MRAGRQVRICPEDEIFFTQEGASIHGLRGNISNLEVTETSFFV